MEEKKFCTICGQEMNINDTVCPGCNMTPKAPLKDKNKIAIAGINTTIVGLILFFLSLFGVFKSFDYKSVITLIASAAILNGLILCIVSIEISKKYEHNYKPATIAMVFVVGLTLSAFFGKRIIDSVGDPCMCGELDTVIDWNSDTSSYYNNDDNTSDTN